MANFSKLNIGDRVASSGLRRFRKLSVEQLPSPYGVSLDGDYLTWGDYSILATSFDILVDGVVKATVSAPTNSFDLSTLGLADGTYIITVVSKASGYANSDPSEAVEYVVGGESIVGTWVFNDVIEQPTSNIRMDFTETFTAWGLSRNTIFVASNSSSTSASVQTHNGAWRDAYYFRSYTGSQNSHTRGWQYSNHTVYFPSDDYTIVGTVPATREYILAWLKANATKTA